MSLRSGTKTKATVYHMSHSIKPSQAQPSLKQAQQPRNPIRPPRLIDKFPEHKASRRIIRTRTRQYGNRNDHKPRNRPRERPLGNPRQQPIRKRIQTERHEIIPDVDQKLMPPLRTIVRLHERNDPDNQLTPQQPPRRHERDPPRHIDPARNPRQQRHPRLPADHRHPMILPARRRIRGQELRQGRRQAEIADARGDEAPDDAGGPAGGEGEGEGGGEGGPGVQDGEGEAEHGEGGEVAVQFGLVPEFGEGEVVFVAGGVGDAVLAGAGAAVCHFFLLGLRVVGGDGGCGRDGMGWKEDGGKEGRRRW